MSELIRDLRDIKYGLMVIDPETLDESTDTLEIVHFVGYWNEPTLDDANSLREELRTDEEFGLTEIADRLEIYPAPDEVVESHVELLIGGESKGKGTK